MYSNKLIRHLYTRLMAIVLLMVLATVVSVMQVMNPVTGGDVQTNVQVHTPSPTPTPSTGVAGTNIERSQPTATPTGIPKFSSNTISGISTRIDATPTPTPSQAQSAIKPTTVTPHVDVTPIACALGPTPLANSSVFCKDIR